LIRALELKLELLEHGLGMPRDEDAIARTKTLLKEAERAGWQALNEQMRSIHPSKNLGP
jgi:hypothetical protein